jgi:hypothetical protein
MKEDFAIQFRSAVATPKLSTKNAAQKAIKYFLDTILI